MLKTHHPNLRSFSVLHGQCKEKLPYLRYLGLVYIWLRRDVISDHDGKSLPK